MRGQLELVDNGLLSDAVAMETAINTSGEVEKEALTADNLVEIVTQYIETCKCNASINPDDAPTKTKNLVEFRRVLVSDFLKSCSSSSAKKCPHCSAPNRTLKQELQAKVFLKPLPKKQATSWAATRNREIARRREMLKEVARQRSDDGQTELGSELMGSSGQDIVKPEDCLHQSYVSPLEAREHMRELWANERLLMDALFGCGQEGGQRSPSDMFFLDVIPVPPSRFRPVSEETFIHYDVMGGGGGSLHAYVMEEWTPSQKYSCAPNNINAIGRHNDDIHES